jgi:anaerobic ribonucleoside-triphosphate reductase
LRKPKDKLGTQTEYITTEKDSIKKPFKNQKTMTNQILQLSNSVQMLSQQAKSSYINEVERKRLLKTKLNKLETLSQQINWEIQETNNQLRFQPQESEETLQDAI